jgi:hypothetical protein
MEDFGCDVGSEIYDQIDEDLEPFDEVDVYANFQKAIKVFTPSTTSICHYVIFENGEKFFQNLLNFENQVFTLKIKR